MTKRSFWDDTRHAAREASDEFLAPITIGARKLFGGAARIGEVGGMDEIVRRQAEEAMAAAVAAKAASVAAQAAAGMRRRGDQATTTPRARSGTIR